MPRDGCNPFDRRGLRRRYGTERLYLHRGSPLTYSNANAAIRRADWERVPFDEDLPYSEDLKWSFAIMAEGRRVVYEPTAAAYHSHNETPRALYDRFYNEAAARTTIGAEPERYRARRLIWDTVGGTVFDIRTAAARRADWRWVTAVPGRRLAINLGRYGGSRGLPRLNNISPATQVFIRAGLRVWGRTNAVLQSLAPHVVKATRKHMEAVHPKHLLRDNEAHYWYGEHLDSKHVVLDLGCNQGMHAIFAAKHAREVAAVDFDRKLLSTAEFNAKWESRRNMSFLLASLENPLPFQSGRFDVVMAFDVIEHLHRRDQFLGEIHRVLRSGGTLLLSAPNGDTRYKRWKKAGAPILRRPHARNRIQPRGNRKGMPRRGLRLSLGASRRSGHAVLRSFRFSRGYLAAAL
ncbi:MAG: methyltransferase domain-containing protein [Deltaproteobacteria bacterium]|nr:methyltransferase domain-containing protein [Deltaproteobacteria bacterium]